MTIPVNRLLILNDNTPLQQLVMLILFVVTPIFIFMTIDLPWSLFAILAWVLLLFFYIEYTRKSYSVYLENGEVIVYNLFNMKGRRFRVQDFDKVTFNQRRVQLPGVLCLLVHFKDGRKFNFTVGDGTTQSNGSMGIFNSEAEILSYVNGLIRAFIAGSQDIPERPFAGSSWR